MRTWRVSLWAIITFPIRVTKTTAHKIHVFCGKYHRKIHKVEHIGNVILLTSVSIGIRELEAITAGCLVFVVLLVTLAGDEV